MTTQSLINIIQMAQFDYARVLRNEAVSFQKDGDNCPKYQIPKEIPEVCNVQISHIDLDAKPVFRKGQWHQAKLLKKRNFKDVNINDEATLAMLNCYYDVVKSRSFASKNKDIKLFNGQKSVFIRSDRKDPTKGMLHLEYGFCMTLNTIGYVPDAEDVRLMRTMVRISFAINKD